MSTAMFTGACRSGKSALAQAWAERQSPRRIFVATARIDDAEMERRVTRHRSLRGEGWTTLEPDIWKGDLLAALRLAAVQGGVALVDCTTLWLADLLESMDDTEILRQLDEVLRVVPCLGLSVAFVHNETGWGIVPEYPLSRRFRDLSGLAGQRLAAACDLVVLAVCGLPLPLKGTFA